MTVARPVRREAALSVVFGMATVLTIFGVWFLRDTPIGGTFPGAIRGIASELGQTGPAAVLVAVVTALDVLVGALVFRALRGAPYTSRIDAMLSGACGAVLLNTVVLSVLGSVGLFTGLVLAIVYLLVGAVGWVRYRPLVDPEPAEPKPAFPTVVWIFLVVAWCGPLVLQLASPVVPFRDVLHNHVAPVEFVRTYHWFPDLFTSPAPETGPTRQILGYLGLLSTVTKLSGRPAVLATAAFAFPLTILVAGATYRFAERVLGRGTGMWALAVTPLTFVFLRLPDARGTVLAVPLVLTSLLPMPELTIRRRAYVRAAALAVVIYVHPLLGLVTLATHGLLAAWFASRERPEEDEYPVAALAGALVFAFPELLLTAGVDAPSWIVILAVPLGLAVSYMAIGLRLPLRELGVALLVVCLIGFVSGATILGPRVWSAVVDEANLYPLMSFGLAVYVFGSRARLARPHLLVPLAVGLLAFVVATFFPDTSLFWRSSRDEVTGKIMQYWSPMFLAFGTAGALRWGWEHRETLISRILVAVFLAAAVLPLRGETVDIENNRERRVAESLSIDLHKAQVGAWAGWPDARTLVDGSQRALIASFRREQAAGRMTRHTHTVHVAVSRWTWDSTPVGAFAGVYHTSVSEAPDVSGHTMGGRLYRYADLSRFLNGRYRYVLLEHSQVPGGLREEILDAGYETIFRNDRGEIFRWED